MIHDDVVADSEILNNKYFAMCLDLLSGLRLIFHVTFLKRAFQMLNEKCKQTSYILILTLGIITCHRVDGFV